jgi:hypothetical protein
MAFQVRRVVTGHDAKGRAVVKIDEVSKNSLQTGRERQPVEVDGKVLNAVG